MTDEEFNRKKAIINEWETKGVKFLSAPSWVTFDAELYFYENRPNDSYKIENHEEGYGYNKTSGWEMSKDGVYVNHYSYGTYDGGEEGPSYHNVEAIKTMFLELEIKLERKKSYNIVVRILTQEFGDEFTDDAIKLIKEFA